MGGRLETSSCQIQERSVRYAIALYCPKDHHHHWSSTVLPDVYFVALSGQKCYGISLAISCISMILCITRLYIFLTKTSTVVLDTFLWTKHYIRQKNKKLPLKSDDEVCIPSLSSILLAVCNNLKTHCINVCLKPQVTALWADSLHKGVWKVKFQKFNYW